MRQTTDRRAIRLPHTFVSWSLGQEGSCWLGWAILGPGHLTPSSEAQNSIPGPHHHNLEPSSTSLPLICPIGRLFQSNRRWSPSRPPSLSPQGLIACRRSREHLGREVAYPVRLFVSVLYPHVPFFERASRALMSPNLACECLGLARHLLVGPCSLLKQLNPSPSVSTPSTDSEGQAIMQTHFDTRKREDGVLF